jgi:hypothetical protein
LRWIRETRVSRGAALSLSTVPLAPLVETLALLIAGRLAEQPAGLSIGYIPRVARTGVLAMVACLAVGLGAGVWAWRRGPRPAAALGVAVNAALLGCSGASSFYRRGFDRDRWASPE